MNIDTKKIKNSLDELDKRFTERIYDKNEDEFQLSIYCKIAALELCGWLEETYDELIKSALKEKGISDSLMSDFDKKFIKKVNGLSYKEHLRPLMINAFGFVEVTRFESKIELEKIERLKFILQELHKYRNHLAHNQYIDFKGGCNPINNRKPIDSPSTIKNKFETIHPILQEIANYFHR